MKTRAAVAFEVNKPLEIVELDLEGPKAGEVLIEIKATGICHSDLHTLNGGDKRPVWPTILGHEGAGIVREVGAGVTTVKTGDHVIPLYMAECRQCVNCLSGKTNICLALAMTQSQGLMPDGTTRFSYKGSPVYHFMGCSTFSNYTVLPEISVAKIRDDAPFESACYIGCGVTTGVGAAINTAGVKPGDTVAVFGLGGIGLNVVQGARLAGASMIIGVDLNEDKAEWGRKYGMTHFVNPTSGGTAVEQIMALTGMGVDYSFACIGITSVMEQAFESARMGWGTAVVVGLAPAETTVSAVPMQLITGRNWRGTAFGGAKGRTDVPKIVDMYMGGQIEIDSMITHKMPLEDINKAFDLMHEGKSVRSVVIF